MNEQRAAAAKRSAPLSAEADCSAVAEPCGSCHARPLGLCATLVATELDRVAHETERLRLSGHDTLFRAGTAADTVYFVASGALKLYQLLPDGRRQIVAFPYPGDFLGYGVNALHGFSAEALTETLLCRFSRPVFKQLLDELPDLHQALTTRTCDELQLAQQQMTLLGRKSAAERLASFLMQLYHKRSHHGSLVLDLPMTRGDIGDYLGLTTETVSRTFSHFRVTGLIRLKGTERVELTGMPQLAALAAGGLNP